MQAPVSLASTPTSAGIHWQLKITGDTHSAFEILNLSETKINVGAFVKAMPFVARLKSRYEELRVEFDEWIRVATSNMNARH